MPKRKLKFWYRKIMLRREEELLRKYSRRIMIHRYLHILPKKHLLKLV